MTVVFPGRNGVAIVISEKTGFALIKWKPVNNCMAYARFKGRFRSFRLSVLQLYAQITATRIGSTWNFK